LHDVPRDGWPVRHVAADANAPVDIDCETFNVPAVMTPWELGQHLSFLIAESLPHPQLPVLQQQVLRFVRQWKGLWAHYGDSPAGRAQFRAAFDAFAAALRPLAQGVTLRNEMPFFQVMMVMISRVAVAPADARAAAQAAGEYA
jgi:hypothetical protein